MQFFEKQWHVSSRFDNFALSNMASVNAADLCVQKKVSNYFSFFTFAGYAHSNACFCNNGFDRSGNAKCWVTNLHCKPPFISLKGLFLA